MAELIATIIFFISLFGIVVILYFKLPVLSTLPKSSLKKSKIVLGAEDRFKKATSFLYNGILLHKFLSWLKCRVIKIETLIDDVLHGLRKKAKEQKLNGKK